MAIWQTAGKVRMTPKGVYNSSIAYEILDIVSNADQTISYIAKQAVPAGTALTNTTYWTVIADVTEALENADAAISYIGDSYSSSSTYAVGDYVIHDGGLYRCKTAISTAEAWNSAHWQQVSVTDEFFNFSDDVVKVSNTQPTSVFNRMWIDSETESEEVPTYEEFQDIESDVTDLKSAFNNLNDALIQNISELDFGKRIFDYVWGNIQPDGTINYNYSPKVRIVTSDYKKFTENTTLSLESGYGLILATYNDDLTLKSRTLYFGGQTIIVPANTLYRACVYNGNITPTRISDFADKLTYISNIQKNISETLSAALSVTNGGMALTTVTDLNTTAVTVMDGDRKAGLYRYDSTAANIPTAASGFVVIYRGGTLYQNQIAMPIGGGVYIRNRYNGTWSTWQRVDSTPRIYRVEKDGSGDFTSLVDCINEATQYMDSKVYVGSGTWDIIDELGSTYVESVSSSQRGVYLKNRIHLIFASNSKVVCKYTGTTENTQMWLSAFNAGVYGFTLENANIECENVRYCVHDERDSDADAYVNKYINCKMHLDNSINTIIRTCNPIGGGLGKNGYIDIDGCWFKGEPTQVYVSQLPLVTYHNSASADAKSHISVKNCYLAGDGRFRFNWYGQSQLITDVEVSGCSMGSSILSQAEVSDSSPYQNISIIEWNNTIRS